MKKRAPGRRVKRTIDIGVAATALLAGAPLILGIAAFVRMALGSPVLFRDERAGLGGAPFTLLKFRTMLPSGGGLADEHRLTPAGRWLRRLSLDELPQFWNVLAGDMSLVGPRPLLVRYLPRYSAEQRRRHEMQPGVTGWAQVHGRNTLTWQDKFALDVWYIDHWSLALDLRILWKTIGNVITARDITPKGAEVMDEFLG